MPVHPLKITSPALPPTRPSEKERKRFLKPFHFREAVSGFAAGLPPRGGVGP
jgi:hypothetical protein